MSKNDGGPAFPLPGSAGMTPVGGQYVQLPIHGMSLRDWFAGQALAGFLADGSQRLVNEAIKESPEGRFVADNVALVAIVNEQLAAGCYALADAMLAQREKDQ